MHYETVSNEMIRILNDFSNHREIYTNFYLAGGTGLALRLGHRRSMDLDFFSEKKFNAEQISETIINRNGKIILSEIDTIHAIMEDVKISFIFYPYPLLRDFILFNQIKLAGIEDIACMKTIAVSQRAEKKYFFDMYEILMEISPEDIKDLLLKKYGENRINCYYILKSFFYFKDAEESVEPISINNTKWHEVKDYFIRNERIFRKALTCD